jgi:hypothetical protein
MERAAARVARNLVYAEQRAEAVRAADATRDPDGSFHRRCRALADDLGLDVVEVLDEWEERAAVREYLGEAVRSEANRLAFADVEARLLPQRRLL